MKRKVWVSSPVFYLITAVMLIMTGISWFFNRILFSVEMTLSLLSILAVMVASEHFKVHVTSAMKSAQKILSGEQYHSLQDFAIAVAVVGRSGDIIWANPAFLNGVCMKHESRGESILKYIYPKTLKQVLADSGVNVSVDGRQYTVYGTRTEKGCILYFVDDTYYKQIIREYNEKRPTVAIISFDNREELAMDAGGNDDARIAAEVDATLREWAQQMGGFLKKMSGGRFLMMTDEYHIAAAAEKRFEILDTIRKIKTSQQRSATISIGVGRGALTLSDSELWARQALDMALGRGGDQVAVHQKDEAYEFFGGLSKGVEKRDKVRTRVIAATLSDHVNISDTVFIMGHKSSDLDSVGSSIGIWSAVTKGLNKPAYLVINRAQSLAGPLIDSIDAASEGKKIFITPAEAVSMVTPKSMLIVADTHSQDFVESTELLNAVSRIVVIDHHRMMVKHISNAVIFYHEPYASSTSEMVTELVQYISESALTRLEAEALLAGIMLDTKNFVFKTGVRTFEASAYLRRRGADTIEVKRMFSNTIGTYKAKYRLVSGADIRHNFAITCAKEEFPDIRIASAQAADELLSIQGVDASFVIFPTSGVVNISARSLGDVNVQVIMEKMGGGGHLTMAGTQIENETVEEVRDRLVELLNNTIQQSGKLPTAEKQ